MPSVQSLTRALDLLGAGPAVVAAAARLGLELAGLPDDGPGER